MAGPLVVAVGLEHDERRPPARTHPHVPGWRAGGLDPPPGWRCVVGWLGRQPAVRPRTV